MMDKELAEISKKFLGIHRVYSYKSNKISNLHDNKVISVCHAYCVENGLMDEFNEFKNQNKLLLSADGKISLYRVQQSILDEFDKLLDDFYKNKTEKSFDETLFVEYLNNRLGEDSISFVRYVGWANSPEPEIEELYRDVKWYNF